MSSKSVHISPAGLVPIEWLIQPMSKVATIEYGISSPIDRTVREGIRILTLPNVTQDGRYNLEEVTYIRDQDVEEDNLLRKGDILFNWRNGSASHIGKTVLFDFDEPMTHVGFLLRIRSKCELLPHYLEAYLKHVKQRGYFLGAKHQVNNTFNKGELSTVPVVIPPFPEQQKIAAILSTWDRAIELTEKLIAAKQKRKLALMQQLLTGKLRFKQFEGKPWSRVPLGKLLKEVKRFVDWNDDAEYHLLSIRRRSGGMFDRETKVGHEIKTKVMMTTETGDFVIARMQAVHGAIAVTPPNCHGKHVSGSYSTFILKDPSKLHMPFLNYVSQTLAFYRLLLLSAYGVTIEKMTFNLPWFLSEKIDLPPTLEEQKRIANVFIAFDEENQLLVQRLERLKQQKKGLMQQLLTGKVRVNLSSLKE